VKKSAEASRGSRFRSQALACPDHTTKLGSLGNHPRLHFFFVFLVPLALI
jgi:hypothetical protein